MRFNLSIFLTQSGRKEQKVLMFFIDRFANIGGFGKCCCFLYFNNEKLKKEKNQGIFLIFDTYHLNYEKTLFISR